MKIKIKKIENGKLPEYKTIGSAGADCFARIDEPQTIKSGKVVTIPLGFAVEIPEGYELQVRGRSGLARKNSVQVFNSPGTIDSDYRGEVGAILYNASEEDFVVNPFDRIAQAIIAPVVRADWEETDELSETERGEGGFGSTGVSDKKVDAFYEPFKNISEVRKYFGKVVEIDDNQNAMVVGAEVKKAIVGTQIEIRFRHLKNDTIETMNSFKAFERVSFEGHRFGREMGVDENS